MYVLQPEASAATPVFPFVSTLKLFQTCAFRFVWSHGDLRSSPHNPHFFTRAKAGLQKTSGAHAGNTKL